MTVDAVIVGSGPGGATVADVLTAAGWSVAIVEKGRNHLLDPDDPTRPAFDYSNDEIKFLSRHFLGPDPLVEPRTFRTRQSEADHTHVGEFNSVPTTVGGGGTHADGKVPRFQVDDFRLRTLLGPQSDAEVADWPIGYDELEPYYAEVERAIGVAGTDGANPFAAPRSGPFPMPSGAPMFGATLSGAAAVRLGYHPYPAPTAANSIPYDGRPACNNCGFCAYFGCPVHAKGDPVAMLLRAMATGRAELMAETFVSRIRTDGRRATGVDLVGPDGVERFMPAGHVVIAAGAIETPRLLLLSGIDHPLIGRYLMTHFQTIVAGSMPFRTYAERGRAVTHVHDDMITGDDATREAAAAAGLPWLRGGMVEHSGAGLPIMEAKHVPWGERHPSLMAGSNVPCPVVGIHHAGRGPSLSRQSGRPRSLHSRRPGLPGGPGDLQPRSSRAGRIGALRSQTGGHPRGDGGGVDHGDHLAGDRERLVAAFGAGEQTQHGDRADGLRSRHIGDRPDRSPSRYSTTWWWPTPRSSSPRPATARPSPWPPSPPAPPI